MPGILETLGSFGRRIINFVRETGQSIREAIGLARPAAPSIEPADVLTDFVQVARTTETANLIADLPRQDPIPDYMHNPTNVPFNRPFAYEITVSGRAVAGRIGAGGVKVGGRFTRDTFNITSNRQLSPEEIERIAVARFSPGGSAALLTIDRMSISGAMSRE